MERAGIFLAPATPEPTRRVPIRGTGAGAQTRLSKHSRTKRTNAWGRYGFCR